MSPEPVRPRERRRVAAFDFDGTLSRRDTLVPFLARAAGPRRFASALGAEGLGMAQRRMARGERAEQAAAHVLERDNLKARTLARVFRGDDPARVEQLALAYAPRLRRLLRPATLERLAWHRDEGHGLVIVSASLAAYLRPLAEELGFDHVIAVELEVGPDGRLTGAMVGPNVRGPEKAVRLRAWLGDADVELWAYGDSDGDEDLLDMADHPVWVGRRARRSPPRA